MKKALSVILALCMLVMLLPAAALADGDVYDVYVYVSAWDTSGDKPVPLHFTFDPSQADDSVTDEPIALYVFGEGDYVLTKDLSDIAFIVNGVNVTLGEGGKIDGRNVFVFGDGDVNSHGLVIESEVSSYDGDETANAVAAFVFSVMMDVPLVLSGEINEIFTANNVLVTAEKSLVIKTAPAGADPNGLNIEKSLTVRDGASLTGEPGQILQIRRDATVEGLTLYDSDGSVWTDNSHDETFNYDAESGKWIRSFEPGPGGPGPGEFRLIYDDNLGLAFYDDDFDGTPNHECHGDFIGTFVAGEGDEAEIKPVTLKFEHDPEAFAEDEAVSVSILLRVFGDPDVENWVVVGGEAVDGYSYADGVFSFTPATDDPFELSMVWTQNAYEFETCSADPDEGQKLVEYNAVARGHVEIEDPEDENIVRVVVDRQRGKIVLGPYAEDVVFTIVPDEDNELDEIRIGRDPGTPVDLDSDTHYDAETGKFTLEIDEEVAEYFIEFVFSDVGPGGPDEPLPDNKYHVAFTDTLGTVKAGGEALENDGVYDFETGVEIAFTLTPNDADADPIVELEVFNGSALDDEPFVPNTVYESRLETDEPENHRYKLALTVSEGVCSFTFTPTSSKHFEVRIYWSDKDRFDSFSCGEDEMFVNYRVKGEGNVSLSGAELLGWCGYHNENDGFDYYKQAVKKTVTSLSVTITPSEGWQLYSLGLAGTALGESAYTVADGVASYTWTELDKGLDVIFVEDGEPGPGPGPEYDYAKAKQQVESRDYAYCGTADEIKGYFAQELWAEIFGELLRWNGEAFESAHAGEFSGMFGAAEAPAYAGDDLVCAVTESFLAAITLGEEQAASEENILDLPYYEYSVALTDGETVATGRIYKLEKPTQFVVRAGEAYIIVDTAEFGEGEDIVIRAAGGENFDAGVFGNGVCVAGGLEAGEGVLWAAHVTQEHSGLDIGNINCRVVIVPNDFVGVRLAGEAWAAPWGFGTVPLYPVGTQNEPAVAVVYCGNDGSEHRVLKLYKDSGVAGSKTVTHVEIDETRLSPAAATITETNDGYFTFVFHTSYGLIPLIVTFDDGSKGYLDLDRTGLDIQEHEVEDGKILVRHGFDGTEYAAGAERAVTGSFYYATGDTQPTESVTLYVTVTTADGVVRREVTRMNESFIGTEGSDKWCDDFLLWSGTEAEWAEVVSVDAEVVSSVQTEGGTVETLTGEAGASSVAFEGTVSANVSAVRVQLLDGENVLASDAFPVVGGGFSGSFEGLALETEKTYTLRAADYDGGDWKTVELTIEDAPTPPTPPTPPSPPSGGGSEETVKYTLTFDSNGGGEIEPVEAAEGTVVDLSEYVPAKDGYEFVGWCGSPSLGDVFEEVELTQDITVYAKWRIACDHGEDCPLAAFTDLDPDAWYHEGVHFCLTRGIMNGIGGGLFDPAGTATRAQIVTMLYRLEGEPMVAGDNPFTDVPADSFYYKSTAWASAEGIVNGYGDGIFAPDDLITREQAATILFRYAKYKGVDTDALSANTNTLSYTDVFTISEFARPAMHFCIAIHVLNGYDGYLRPQDTAARTEVAAMFQRLCDVIF